MRWGVLALACLASTISCYSPKLTGCNIACGNAGDNECPSGLSCTAGFCRRADGDTCGDAGSDGPMPGRLFKAITAGHEHACAVTLDGRLFCWGANLHGQVKEQPSTTENIGVPVVVTGVLWDKVDAGQRHTCAIGVHADMTKHVYCWGNNETEQCGVDQGGNAQVLVPTEVQGIVDPVEIAAGDRHTCARTGEGRLFCWGENADGQFGNGGISVASTEIPTEVEGATTDWDLITAGAATTCATKSDGQVFCWGANDNGETGTGSIGGNVVSPTLVVVSAGPVTAISLNGVVGCMVHETPEPVLRCWGNNSSSETGQDNVAADVDRPNTMSGLGNMGIWASVNTGLDFACGVTTAGKIHCWGADDERLGDDNTCFGCRSGFGPQMTAPVKPDTDVAFAIAVGSEFGCALFGENATTGGVARCWGKNEHGQLGNSAATRIPRASPTAATGSSWITVRLGRFFGCGVQSDNTTWCWGDNAFKQVSTSVVAKEASPVERVDALGAFDIALGDNHACALVSASGGNAVRCWGSNAAGELGIADVNATTSTPVLPVNGNWKSIHAADNATCLARVNGEYVCWGSASWLPGAPAIAAPIQVSFLTNFTSLRMGPDSGCAISGGQVACFGADTLELRGTGTDTELPATPTAAKFMAGPLVGVIGSSDTDEQGSHRCAFTLADTFCWGLNDHHQAGGSSGATVSTAQNRFASPLIVATGSDVDRTIVSGAEFTCAIAADHTVRCWGFNGQQQLTELGPNENISGIGEPTQISVSTQAPGMTFRSLAAGPSTVCGITDDASSSLLCWGTSGRGEAATGDSDKDLLVDVVTF